MEQKITKTKKFQIGYRDKNKLDREYEVIEVISTAKRRIRFLESGCEKIVHTKSIYDNAIKDDGYKSTSKYNLFQHEFGEWTVISETPFIKNEVNHWTCRCSCGEVVDVSQNSLISKTSRRCEKCRFKAMFKDDKYIGETFGEISVVSVDSEYYKEKKRRKYICKCSCGYEFSSFSHNLIKLEKCKECKERDKSIIGKRYTRLIVLKEFKKDGSKRCICKCDCGNEVTVRRGDLLSDKTKSCGCLSSEVSSNTLRTHGMSKTRIHNIWSAMKQRCYYAKNSRYDAYGARGIEVCDEWRDDFVAFREWSISNGYDDSLSIDRIDVNGNYEPSNCRWATDKTQANNKTSNRYITYKGATKTLIEWSEELGINYSTLRSQTRKYTLDEIIGE